MKIIHINKTGKINEIPLTNVITKTRHVIAQGKTRHEGWMVGGDFEDKGHQYFLMLEGDEPRQHLEWLQTMVSRFETDVITDFITDEEEA